MKFIGLMLVVNWSDRLDAGFLRLKKNTTLSFPNDYEGKSKLSHIYEWEKEIILKPAGTTFKEPWGRDANTIISDDRFWLPKDEECNWYEEYQRKAQ